MNMRSKFVQVPDVQAGSFFRETGELVIQIPALVRPTFEELRARFDWIRSAEPDISPVETSFLRLGTVLREDEKYPINGNEYRRRIASSPETFFGYQQADLLMENQNEFPEFAEIFSEIYDDCDLYAHPYVDFLGLVVLDENGSRFCSRISVDGKERLYMGWTWLDRGLRPNGRIAIAGPPICMALR